MKQELVCVIFIPLLLSSLFSLPLYWLEFSFILIRAPTESLLLDICLLILEMPRQLPRSGTSTDTHSHPKCPVTSRCQWFARAVQALKSVADVLRGYDTTSFIYIQPHSLLIFICAYAL